jgi:hypothetical protein
MKNDQLIPPYVIRHFTCLVGRLRNGEDPKVIADEFERILEDHRQRNLSHGVLCFDYVELLEQIAEYAHEASIKAKAEKNRGS